VANNSGFSIYIRLSSDKITIDNCTVNNNGEELGGGWIHSGSIYIDGENYCCSNITISQCIIHNNIGAGIHFAQSINVTIHHNKIFNNTEFGITSSTTAKISIHNNDISRNTWNGILIWGKLCQNINIHNNQIYNNGNGEVFDGGILLQECTNCVTIQHNNISLNNPYGIYLICSSENKIISNNFINNCYNAFFRKEVFFSKNYWLKNYWDKPRWSPKPIFGKIQLENKSINWVNFDWYPAKEINII